MRALLLLALLSAAVGGCSGHYVISAPDQVAAAGGQAATVVRLQKHEFAGVLLPVKRLPVRLQTPGGPLRGAFTDDAGYAAATVPAPSESGLYTMEVALQDRRGDEAAARAPFYVFRPDAAVTAVDLGALPDKSDPAARSALTALAAKGGVIYMTTGPLSRTADIRSRLLAQGYPDGPILLWQSQGWHVVRDGALPRIVVESRLVSPLDHLRTILPGLTHGITSQDDGARELARAGLKVVFIGRENPHVKGVSFRRDWTEVAAVGL
jgi:hypothetical protein